MFCIVEFLGDDTVDIVPESWLCDGETQCYWPNWVSASKIQKAIRKQEEPDRAEGSSWGGGGSAIYVAWENKVRK